MIIAVITAKSGSRNRPQSTVVRMSKARLRNRGTGSDSTLVDWSYLESRRVSSSLPAPHIFFTAGQQDRCGYRNRVLVQKFAISITEF